MTTPPGNQLGTAASPYLRQHADQPVHWKPWGPSALDQARAEQKPIFLSAGYSACHWCHVMAHECFENNEVAAVLNAHFVSIKLDREEHPDVDALYMQATQLMTQRGGWPNSVFLTPDLKPFYAGTYFPKDSFLQVLKAISAAWSKQQPELLEQAGRLHAALQQINTPLESNESPGAPIEKALNQLQEQFDSAHGGFGEAPKFPPHAALRLLMDVHERKPQPHLNPMLIQTLDALYAGGIHDHVGGGFHRYATDNRWFLPHFEKMLYDNAQLATMYARAWHHEQNPVYRQACRDICDWVLREMTEAAGGFYSSIDADSPEGEGAFYSWSLAQLAEVLPTEDLDWFTHQYNVSAKGNAHDEATGQPTGTNILFLNQPATSARHNHLLALLRTARERRPGPETDRKIVTAWNGLMISALSVAGRHLDRPDYVAAAERAATFVLSHMRAPDGSMVRSWCEGHKGPPACLDDYAFFADGLMDLHRATSDPVWLAAASNLCTGALEQFEDKHAGGCLLGTRNRLPIQVRDGTDGAEPSGNGVLARALSRLYRVTGRKAWRQAALRQVDAFSAELARAPAALTTLSLVWSELHGPDALPGTTATELSVTWTCTPTDTPSVRRIEASLTPPPGWRVQLTPSVFKWTAKGGHLTDIQRPGSAGSGETIRLTANLHIKQADPHATLHLTVALCGQGVCRPPQTIEHRILP